jgi:hypothetical protein
MALPSMGCTTSSESFTLYRNSADDRAMRIHVATFDSTDGEKYNAENCDLAASLFGGQAGIKVRFWCERGAFKK